jgi:hypothetical protein
MRYPFRPTLLKAKGMEKSLDRWAAMAGINENLQQGAPDGVVVHCLIFQEFHYRAQADLAKALGGDIA